MPGSSWVDGRSWRAKNEFCSPHYVHTSHSPAFQIYKYARKTVVSLVHSCDAALRWTTFSFSSERSVFCFAVGNLKNKLLNVFWLHQRTLPEHNKTTSISNWNINVQYTCRLLVNRYQYFIHINAYILCTRLLFLSCTSLSAVNFWSIKAPRKMKRAGLFNARNLVNYLRVLIF